MRRYTNEILNSESIYWYAEFFIYILFDSSTNKINFFQNLFFHRFKRAFLTLFLQSGTWFHSSRAMFTLSSHDHDETATFLEKCLRQAEWKLSIVLVTTPASWRRTRSLLLAKKESRAEFSCSDNSGKEWAAKLKFNQFSSISSTELFFLCTTNQKWSITTLSMAGNEWPYIGTCQQVRYTSQMRKLSRSLFEQCRLDKLFLRSLSKLHDCCLTIATTTQRGQFWCADHPVKQLFLPLGMIGRL